MLPKKPITAKVNLSGLTLADPDFSRPREIDLILGAHFIDQELLEGLQKGPADSPIAQSSIFGWLLMGVVGESTKHTQHVTTHHVHVEQD